MKELLLNLDRINKDKIKYGITINYVIDCGCMCVVNYTIRGRVFSKDLYYNKSYSRDIYMLIYVLRRWSITV